MPFFHRSYKDEAVASSCLNMATALRNDPNRNRKPQLCDVCDGDSEGDKCPWGKCPDGCLNVLPTRNVVRK